MNKISTIVLFKTGIRPEWEDKMNANGGLFVFKLKQDHEKLHELWTQLVCNIVIGAFPNSENINGIRFLEKHQNAKFEIWTSYHEKDGAEHKALEKKVTDVVGAIMGIDAPSIDFGKHGEVSS